MSVAAIVLQYGKSNLTEQCLRDLRAQKGVELKIWLVDGASPDFDEAVWSRLAAQADHAIRLEQNQGYAGGNNAALRQIMNQKQRPEFVLVLNNDTELSSGTVQALVETAQRHPKAAQVCPCVMYPDGRIQAAGGTIREDLFEPQMIGHLADTIEAGERTARFAPGMAVLVRTEAIAAAGLLPEDYFLYAEDVDWSLQFAKKGWEIWVNPVARVTHYESAATGTFHPVKGYYLTRANVLLARRWLDGAAFRLFARRFRWKLIRQSVKRMLRPKYVAAMWRGYRAGLAGRTGA